MILIFFGPPGAGKGTQASRIGAAHNLKQLSTGDILRVERASGSELGKTLARTMDAGELVSDDLVNAAVKSALAQPGDADGFILDGYPRSVPQAEALTRMLDALDLKLDAVIELQVDEAALVERISGRFSCANCGESYHDTFRRPLVEGVCDKCGHTEFKRRPDDSPDKVQVRLDVYRRETEPLLAFYRDTGLIQSVDGMAEMDSVTQAIEAKLAGLKA